MLVPVEFGHQLVPGTPEAPRSGKSPKHFGYYHHKSVRRYPRSRRRTTTSTARRAPIAPLSESTPTPRGGSLERPPRTAAAAAAHCRLRLHRILGHDSDEVFFKTSRGTVSKRGRRRRRGAHSGVALLLDFATPRLSRLLNSVRFTLAARISARRRV